MILKIIILEVKEQKNNGINVTVPFKKSVIQFLVYQIEGGGRWFQVSY